jgi:peptidoglycan hydrolase-like protein with peptidoglycan-binding domain
VSLQYGAWTQDYQNMIPMMGSDGGRIQYAVQSIQTELVLNSCNPGGLDGIFGPLTEQAVKQFQNNKELKADGIVGPITARELCQLRIRTIANGVSVSPAIVGGIVRVESAYDFGAVGYVDHADRGLGQINANYHPTISNQEAFSSTFSLAWVTDYMRAALLEFKDDECAIASYNLGTVGAQTWCKDKSSNPTVQAYVDNVLKGA